MELNPYLNFGKANIKTLKDEWIAIDEFNIIEDDDHSPQNKPHYRFYYEYLRNYVD